MELPTKIAALYIDYMFSDHVIDKGLSDNAAAFHNGPSESIDEFELRKLQESNRAAFHDGPPKRPDIAPELQPLSPKELQEYNRKVAKRRAIIEDKKSKDNPNKNLDNEMPISLL